ncbi:RDD family protein [Streptomyces muensis]|uniref:RDD family protein n=1 Tax=Streptomyces muensis TaxID=1077944 RepID=A0A9X1PWU7_STRM4|nr:RDD family protein [Streptomyces muensis]MCF1594947.1 RDD family protein [Streptomyces muensis]
MSAPTPAPGDDRPREGYYPDPSIPGYVRYWNGASWVPGTSRPAPTDGEPLAPPPGANPDGPAAAPAAPVEETGPHFFDEDPEREPASGRAQHGSRPEPASAWGADPAHQAGFGGDQDHRVSWGAQQEPDPREPRAAAQPDGQAASTDGTATIPPAEPEADSGNVASGDTFMIRRPVAGIPSPGGPAPADGTMAIRAVSPRTGAQGGGTGASAGSGAARTDAAAGAPQGPGFGAGKAAAERAAGAQGQARTAAGAASAAQSAGASPTALSGPQQAQQQAAPSIPQQSAGSGAPMTAGPGGGQSSWAQQVHRLAGPGEDQPVAPWKPPTLDPFQAAAMRQAAARPAGLGKRLAARLLDTVVLAAVTAVAAVPLGTKAIDHVNGKIDAAKLSGETVTVWLLDGTTSVYLGIILAVLLLFGAVYEVLPTVKWGRTLGKKLLGLEVRDIEAHEPPEFGAALKRWLVYSIPGLLVVGVVGVLWCVFDRPWHQCWHDKAARTFVAG